MNKTSFNPSREDIEGICRFFDLGQLRDYEIEKGISFPHANFFIFVATGHGAYALKFYPLSASKTIAVEYAVNRILNHNHFPTPVMHAGVQGKTFFTSNGCLATCFSYINGASAWKHIKERHTIHQINAALHSLKNILSVNSKRIPLEKQASLTVTINGLLRASRATVPQDQKRTIDASLLDACRTYRHHRALFTRQWIHNDANLTNFLIYKKTIYTLDLSHVREDYVLSDLASLVVSCLLSLPAATVRSIVQDYFTCHKMAPAYFPVLHTLVKIGLVKEYIGKTQDEKSRRSIAALLKKMNDAPGLIV